MALNVGEIIATFAVDRAPLRRGLRQGVQDIRQAGGQAQAAGRDVGMAVLDGVRPEVAQIAQAVAGEVERAGTASVSPSRKAGKKAGEAVGQGVGEGVDKGTKDIPEKVKDRTEESSRDRSPYVRVGGRIGEHITAGIGGGLGKLKGVVATAVAAAGLAEGIDRGLEEVGSRAHLAARLGLSPQDAQRAGRIAGALFAANYGESLDQVNDAVARVTQDIGLTLGAVDFKPVTAKVLTLAQEMGEDVGGVTRAVGQLMRTGLVSNAGKALDVITAGFQNGANRADDLLDTLNEYPTQFRDLGLTGAQSMGLLVQGLRAGARDSDIVADALKEMNIRVKDGTAADALKKLGLSGKAMALAFARGGPQATKALQSILDKLRAVKNPADRFTLAQQILGTQSEDLSRAFLALDPSKAVDALGQVGGAAERMSKTVADSPKAIVDTWKRRLTQGINNGAATVVTTVATMAPRVRAGLAGVVDAIRTGSTDASGALGVIEGTAANVGNAVRVLIGQDLADGAESGLTRFADSVHDRVAPSIGAVVDVIQNDIVPAAVGLFDTVADGIHPFVVLALWLGRLALLGGVLGAKWGSKVLPVLIHFAGPILGGLIRALGLVFTAASATLGFVEHHSTAFAIVGGIVASIFIPALIAAGIQATITGARVVASWVAMQAGALASSARLIGVWVATQAAGVTGAAAQSLAILRVVGGWVLMGAQSLLAAGKVAAAWLIAMGPIALVIAAVVGLVVLIVANWDKVWGATKRVWGAVTGAVSGAWRSITGFVSSGVSSVVGFIKGIPGKIGAVGSAMFNAGKNLLTKVFDGMKSLAGKAGGFAVSIAKAIGNKLIDGLNAILPHKFPTVDTHIPGIGKIGGWPMIPTIHHFARGTLGATGLALLGERGPEIVDLGRSPVRVHNASDSRAMMSGRGAGPAPAPITAADLADAVEVGTRRAFDASRLRLDQRAGEVLARIVRTAQPRLARQGF